MLLFGAERYHSCAVSIYEICVTVPIRSLYQPSVVTAVPRGGTLAPTPTWQRHDFCEHSAGAKDRRVCELWVQFLCRCGETRGVFPGRKGFGRCGVDEREMRRKRAECVGAMVGVGAGNPLRPVCRIRYSVGSGGPGQVLSGPIRGPDEERFKNNSQIRCTGAKIGLERGGGFGNLGALLRMAIYHQKHVVLHFFFEDRVAMSPPIHVRVNTKHD